MEVILAQPRGFCAGVRRAIEIVERVLEIHGPPVYVRHEIVHNRYVVSDLESKGVIFVDEIDDIPEGAITIFSAHGVSETIVNEAKLRELPTIDATCPLVTKVHNEAIRSEEAGKQIILIGHAGHPEVEGTSGRVKGEVILVESVADVSSIEVNDPEKLSYVTQTTLSVDDTRDIIEALRARFPAIQGPELRDICYATQNRQNAVRELARQVDVLLVIGSQNSSNSNRLRDLGEEIGTHSYLINSAEEIDSSWFSQDLSVGVTAGASAPELLVEQVVAHLGRLYPINVSTMEGKIERTRFKLPPEVA